MKRFRLLLVLLTLLVLVSSGTRSEPKPARILHQVFDSIKNIKTLRYKVSALERIETKFLSAASEIKLQTHPRKVYFYNRLKKLEILYNAELQSDKALVKPHVFPYLTLNLDPTGNLMRKNQHYTIHELGFDFMAKSIAFTISKDKDGLANFTYKGRYNKTGSNGYLLEYENKAYSYVDYTVGEKETASVLAVKLGVNDYLLRYKNDLLNDFGYLKKGSVLKVPTLYCKKAVLFIDEKLMLPVSISLYDDAGLFESYDFTAIEINKAIAPEEFTRNYRDYHF